MNLGFDLDSRQLKQLRVTVQAGIRRAAREAVAETSRDLELKYEAATRDAGLPKLARVWANKQLPISTRDSARGDLAVAIVFPKGGARTKGAIRAFSKGAQIRGRSGLLWWPTGYNKAGGRRNERKSGARVSVQEMLKIKGAFVINTGNGIKLWCLPVYEAQQRGINGRIYRQAFTANSVQVGVSRKRAGIKRTEGLLNQGFVPMFIGTAEVNLEKRFDLKAVGGGFDGRLSASFREKLRYMHGYGNRTNEFLYPEG